MKRIVIDGKKIATEAAVHEYLAEKLNFPGYYGKNLDALADCLSEISYPLKIKIKNSGLLLESLGDTYRVLISVFEDSAVDNNNLTIKIK